MISHTSYLNLSLFWVLYPFIIQITKRVSEGKREGFFSLSLKWLYIFFFRCSLLQLYVAIHLFLSHVKRIQVTLPHISLYIPCCCQPLNSVFFFFERETLAR